VLAADDVGEDLKRFLAPDPVDAEWAPPRLAKNGGPPAIADRPTLSTPSPCLG
jgi:hypothetical protein